MELMSLEKREIILDTLMQIRDAISNLIKWNEGIEDMDSLLKNPGGMQDLAGNCMIIMAIGEGYKKIEKLCGDALFVQRPEIPWRQVFGLRNRIAHGYFDIDTEIISEVIRDDLKPLLDATNHFIQYMKADVH